MEELAAQRAPPSLNTGNLGAFCSLLVVCQERVS